MFNSLFSEVFSVSKEKDTPLRHIFLIEWNTFWNVCEGWYYNALFFKLKEIVAKVHCGYFLLSVSKALGFELKLDVFESTLHISTKGNKYLLLVHLEIVLNVASHVNEVTSNHNKLVFCVHL